jgi:hypothetical protein
VCTAADEGDDVLCLVDLTIIIKLQLGGSVEKGQQPKDAGGYQATSPPPQPAATNVNAGCRIVGLLTDSSRSFPWWSKRHYRSLNFFRCVIPVYELLKSVIPVHELLKVCHPDPYTFKVCNSGP